MQINLSIRQPLSRPSYDWFQGRIQGGAHPARASPKIEKKYDFLA
jgi:hypothetical protein